MLNATKVPVVDQYAVQKQSQQENRTNPEKQGINKKQKQQTDKPKTHNQNKNETKKTEKGLQPADVSREDVRCDAPTADAESHCLLASWTASERLRLKGSDMTNAYLQALGTVLTIA